MRRACELGRTTVLPLVLVVIVLSGAVVGLGQASLAGDATAGGTQFNPDGVVIQNVTFEGDGYNESQYETVTDHPGPPYVWQKKELRLNTTVESRNDSGSFSLCGRAFSEEGNSSVSFGCEQFGISSDSTQNVSLSLDTWPDNATGNHTIVLELRKSSLGGDNVVDKVALQVVVIEQEGDLTGDGLTNGEEFEHGTDFTTPDTSGNGLTDWEEVKKYGTDPLVLDTTGDGVNDATLVRLGLDPTEPYLLHQYLAAVIIGLLGIAWAAVLLVRRYRAGRSDTSDQAGAPGAHGTWTDQDVADNETGEQQQPIDESILTNEEVVCRLLDRNEGRMRQSQIIESTDWSKAKVSRVLSDLEEEGVVNRIRIGRENLVDLQSESDDVEIPN